MSSRPASPIDCLLVGANQMRFADYEAALRGMGERSGAYRDLRPSFFHEQGELVTCRDFCNRQQPGDGFSYDDMLSATLTCLGSFLHQRGFSFDFINTFQEGQARLAELLASGAVRSVAVTTTYYVSPLPLQQVIDFVRRVAPGVPIIVGGPFIRTQQAIHDPAAFRFMLERLGADYYIVSDQGEASLAALLDALRSGKGLAGIPNLIWRSGQSLQHNPLQEEDNALAENMVEWPLFAQSALPHPRRMVMVRTAKSCPFSCAFCSFPEHAGTYRYLAAEDVWRELDAIEALGHVRSVTFIDDTFNVPPRRFREIMTGIRDRGYSFRWNCNFRCQYATAETVALMREAGCEGVFLGIESGSDTILGNMNKQAQAADYARGIALLRDAGILTYASFVVGFPGETSETVRTTIDFIERTGPDFFRAQLWYYDTMTPIHRQAARFGLRNSQFEWVHNTMDAVEAANWVSDMHRSIRNSIWLPQNDFDFPALFCLQARGWSIAEIKSAVGAFNRRVLSELEPQARPGQADAPAPGFALADFDFGEPARSGCDHG